MPAEVVEIKRIRGKDNDTFRPIFKYRSHLDGELIHEPNRSSSSVSRKVGDQTQIVYDPNNPKNVKVVTYR